MKRYLPITFMALLCGCQTHLTLPVPAMGPGDRAELVVRFAATTTPEERLALRKQHDVRDAVGIAPDAERWRLGTPTDAYQLIDTLANDSRFKYAQPNYVRNLNVARTVLAEAGNAPFGLLAEVGVVPALAPNDPDFPRQWHLPRAKFPEAWVATRGLGVTVAVIDSGCDPEHPDLKANLLPLIDEVVAMGNHDLLGKNNYDQRDGHGHGTHVCGLVGAIRDNGIGVCGGAPDVKILPVKVTASSGDADDATISKGITDAVDKGAQVINLSIGGPEPSPVLLDALNYAFNRNVVVVIASGNDGQSVNFPAAYDGVISVGAITPKDKVASYSSHGRSLVMVAPGGGPPGRAEGDPIFSTTPTYPCYITLFDHKSNNYGSLAGTSMASPLVTAAAALVLGREPGLTPAQMRTRLAAATDDGGEPGYDEYYGFGVLNVERAIFFSGDDGRKP